MSRCRGKCCVYGERKKMCVCCEGEAWPVMQVVVRRGIGDECVGHNSGTWGWRVERMVG